MSIQLQNKRSADFPSTTMSDLVFLILIFFMITSTMVAPNAINVLLPKSDAGQQLSSHNIEVYIDANKFYYVNPQPNSAPVPYDAILPLLREQVQKDFSLQRNVILRADKSIPVEELVKVMDVLNQLNNELPQEQRYKLLLATEAK
jgi:biopolymer transport protein ExbD